MSDDKRAREERRKKIRDLEATLFGTSTFDALKVDVPQLKSVDEYTDRFGKAERQKRFQPQNVDSYLSTLKSLSTKSKTTKRSTNFTNVDDTNHLLSDDDNDDEGGGENYDATRSFGQVTHVTKYANLYKSKKCIIVEYNRRRFRQC